jgi:hypothetical protein
MSNIYAAQDRSRNSVLPTSPAIGQLVRRTASTSTAIVIPSPTTAALSRAEGRRLA